MFWFGFIIISLVIAAFDIHYQNTYDPSIHNEKINKLMASEVLRPYLATKRVEPWEDHPIIEIERSNRKEEIEGKKEKAYIYNVTIFFKDKEPLYLSGYKDDPMYLEKEEKIRNMMKYVARILGRDEIDSEGRFHGYYQRITFKHEIEESGEDLYNLSVDMNMNKDMDKQEISFFYFNALAPSY